MKGSVVVFAACFALFFAAPSHSYSVKFISENDQVANRRDTQSGSPSPDVATAGDAFQNNDTSAGESKTIKMDGDTKPGDEPVSGDAQPEKSNIRKRDTRSLVRDMMDIKENVTSKPVTRNIALYLLQRVQYLGDKCFKEILKYLEERELQGDSYRHRENEVRFTRSGMIRWLKMIQKSMSKCLRNMIEPLRNGAESSFDDDDTPNSVKPPPDPFVVSELLQWFGDIGKTLEKSLKDAINVLKEKSEDPTDTVRRSSETVSDISAELMEILSQIYGGALDVVEPPQSYPPDESVPPLPIAVPLRNTYKKSNFLDKPRGYRYITNLPALIFERPPIENTEEIPNSISPQLPGFRFGAQQVPDFPGITTLPEDVNARPTLPISLLQAVLGEIYSRLQGTVPPVGSIGAPPAESLRGDANGGLGLYRGSEQVPAMEIRGILDTDLLQCLEEYMNKIAQRKMVNGG